MKTAIISDIHANPTALQTCIEDAERKGCTRFVCLGEIVGYGYDPNACISICRRMEAQGRMLCLMGNHEAGMIGHLPLNWFSYVAKQGIERQSPVISSADKSWLDSLSLVELEGCAEGFPVAYAHGTYELPGRFDYINDYSEAAMEFPSLRAKGIKALFVGHTHFANAYFYSCDCRISETYLDLEDERPLHLDGQPSAIVNVGSCGYPRNQPYSIYCIYDDEKKTATHRIIEFDFDDYRTKMAAAGIEIPIWLDNQEKRAQERRVEWK